ncbi:cupin domain-containing protein [Streptomyces sp. NPDC006332]|uniref:cupin domain-containing protein n=1 Tax=Streptomyces sp. NPDC006332 TaxID=3155456 RepID=UPI0033B46458
MSITEATPQTLGAQRVAFVDEVHAFHASPVFITQPGFMPAEPSSAMEPYLWRWADIRPAMLKSADLLPVGADGADRRVLNLINPGMEPKIGTTHTLTASIQMVLPGEVADAHRHTINALRLILEGRGASTTVDGEMCELEPGDVVLTSGWRWHDHRNDGDEPVIWLDGLDLPLMRSLESIFYEELEQGAQPVNSSGDSIRHYGVGQLLPTWTRWEGLDSPLFNYKWADTRRALDALRDAEGDPFDGVSLEFRNPTTGGSIGPTMSCGVNLLRAGVRAGEHRHTSSTVYHVIEGDGVTVVDGKEFVWTKGDTFVVPTWAWHRHANTSSATDAVLFNFSDRPLMEKIGLYREESG